MHCGIYDIGNNAKYDCKSSCMVSLLMVSLLMVLYPTKADLPDYKM